MKLLYGHDKVVADWASKQFAKPLQNWYWALGIIDKDGILVGAATFHDYNESNVELCFWGPDTLRLNIVRGIMAFCFHTLKVNRITCRTPRQNKVVIQGLPKLGFRMEGVMKHYYGPVKRLDAIMFGLLKADSVRFIGHGTNEPV